MQTSLALFKSLNQEYLAVHKTKEDLFWDTYMAVSDDHASFAKSEAAYKHFISDPERLRRVREALAALRDGPGSAEKDALQQGLEGWRALFECNIIDKPAARKLMEQLIHQEAVMFGKRRGLILRHINESGVREEATFGMLSTNLATNPSEVARKSSHDALMSLEHWVLSNGFLDIVRTRNAFARAQGFGNYFEYKVRKNEGMTSRELFAILDDFEVRTRQANQRGLDAVSARHGSQALKSCNLRFFMGGDVTRQSDPYLPFGKALERWVHSFRNLGISYRGATLQLDLLARTGKYQNGFCHAPVPSHFNDVGQWVPGQINFTAEAKPDQVGSGARAIHTLFHEGGHAAHFANVTQNSPCFSQEFAPTSMAYAETQSMFFASLLEDADWLTRYARNAQGQPMPAELVRRRIDARQPYAAHMERGLLVVPYFERALYQLEDGDLNTSTVLALARACEQRVLGVSPGPRPILAIPHLLNQESAASYHGYLLANMAVYQTRAYFERTYGFLTDNPAIGPAMAEHYWACGNRRNHNETLASLTGESFNARYLADHCNLTAQQAWERAQVRMAAAQTRVYPQSPSQSLDATIRVVHGTELVADNGISEAVMCSQFEAWVQLHYPQPPAAIAA